MMKRRAELVDAYLLSCTRTGGLPGQGLVTPALRNFEIPHLPSAVDVQDRLELSDCFFQTTEQIHPIIFQSSVSSWSALETR